MARLYLAGCISALRIRNWFDATVATQETTEATGGPFQSHYRARHKTPNDSALQEKAMATHRITEIVPVFGIGSYDEAVAFYVDWLGFSLDWEWREAPGCPVIMAISREGASLMLNEHPDSPSASEFTLKVTNLYAFAEEWNAKRPESVSVAIEPLYDIPSIYVRDPFGNGLDFQQPLSAAQEEDRKHRASLMREYVRKRLADGHQCPTPSEVVEAIGRPVGMAMAILCEFPQYEQAKQHSE